MTNFKLQATNFCKSLPTLISIVVLLLLPIVSVGQVRGCTDSLSLNYNPNATVNDGSCIYPETTIKPTETFTISDRINETSGLIYWDNKLWTQNDGRDTHIYSLDIADGAIKDSFDLAPAKNIDWEEIAQDSTYLYVGDFGNNVSGNRTDLQILRVEKESLLSRLPAGQEGMTKIDTISFKYGDQTDFNEKPVNETDFDCEAFFVTENHIYLITKQWKRDQSAFYKLPKSPGNYQAERIGTLDVKGLTTGCTYLDKKILALSGYDHSLNPFIYLLYNFEGTDFLDANKRKIKLALPLHQVEAITTNDGLNYFITNEHFDSQSGIIFPQQLHKIDLAPYLGQYIAEKDGLGLNEVKHIAQPTVFPNPSKGHFWLKGFKNDKDHKFQIFNVFGQVMLHGSYSATNNHLDLSGFSSGIYFLKIDGQISETLKLIKR